MILKMCLWTRIDELIFSFVPVVAVVVVIGRSWACVCVCVCMKVEWSYFKPTFDSDACWRWTFFWFFLESNVTIWTLDWLKSIKFPSDSICSNGISFNFCVYFRWFTCTNSLFSKISSIVYKALNAVTFWLKYRLLLQIVFLFCFDIGCWLLVLLVDFRV